MESIFPNDEVFSLKVSLWKWNHDVYVGEFHESLCNLWRLSGLLFEFSKNRMICKFTAKTHTWKVNIPCFALVIGCLFLRKLRADDQTKASYREAVDVLSGSLYAGSSQCCQTSRETENAQVFFSTVSWELSCQHSTIQEPKECQ